MGFEIKSQPEATVDSGDETSNRINSAIYSIPVSTSKEDVEYKDLEPKLISAVTTKDWSKLNQSESARILSAYCKTYGFDPILGHICLIKMTERGKELTSIYVTADGVDSLAARYKLSSAPETGFPKAFKGLGANGQPVAIGWECQYRVTSDDGRYTVDGCLKKLSPSLYDAYARSMTTAKRRAILSHIGINAVPQGDEPDGKVNNNG